MVVAQDPPPSTQTSEIRLLVNRGEDRATYVMPDLIGLNGDRAADVMRSRGFRVSITAQSAASTIPPGVVVRQTPQGGYQVHPGDADRARGEPVKIRLAPSILAADFAQSRRARLRPRRAAAPIRFTST